MSDKRLSPEVRDKLVQKLRENLSRDRPRKMLWTIVGLTILGLAFVGLWYGFQPREPLPPLMLVVFDGLDDHATVKAQLVAPGNPETNLEGLDIHWKWRGESAVTKTDREGVALYPLGLGIADMQRAIVDFPNVDVSFVDPDGAYRRDARIELRKP